MLLQFSIYLDDVKHFLKGLEAEEDVLLWILCRS